MTPAIWADKLCKRFGSFVAVDAIDLEVAQGELFGMLGPNGAGKTTVVRMLTGIVPISSGEARVAGIDVRRNPDAVRRAIGVVPQALTSDLDLTGYENLGIFAKFYDIPRAEWQPRVRDLLHRVALWDRRDEVVKNYSGGMRRRLEMARGLVHRPKVLFLDEPTIGLDPQSRLVVWDLLRGLRKEGGGLTIILTTHYLEEAEVLCDRVAIIDRGRIVALGSPDELKSQLAGSDTIDLALSGPVPAELLAELRGLSGVRTLDARDGEAPHLRVRASHGAELLPRLLAVLMNGGVPVESANLSRITLEDVFIHYTGRSLREDTPAAGAPRVGPARRFT